ncbi:MAG: DUF1460 domain-containing protein [Fibrobacteres bacterium]|nr:DUF1460 domain-containing protein [Fibrobacterota bacterium]
MRIFFLLILSIVISAVAVPPADSLIFKNIIGSVIYENIETGRYITNAAQQFDGYPYVAGLLEKGDDKKAIVNLREFDCVTLVEAVSAISVCIKSQNVKYSDFENVLTRFRYRDGRPTGYESRLHYFSEWLHNGVNIGFLDFVRPDSSYDTVRKVSFMTENNKLYAPLKDQKVLKSFKAFEKQLSDLKIPLVKTARVHDFEKNIREGDIIAFASGIKGLDYSHTALAFWKKNDRYEDVLHFIHASSKVGRVVLSGETLQEYLASHRNVIGITVARIK